MPKGAMMVGRGGLEYDHKTKRVITTLTGLTKTGETGVINTCVCTVEDFKFWHAEYQRVLKIIERHEIEDRIASLPKGRRRKMPSNVVNIRSKG